MAAARSIYLTGFSGSGKSTIAALVGARLGWPVLDTDRIIVEQSGMSIPTIFECEGEAGFRARETEALRSVTSGGPYVIATGGGLPVRAENRRLMAASGWVIQLDTRPEKIQARIQEQLARAHPDAVRPMLAAVDPLEQTRALKYSRQPLYALADWTIHTDRLTAEQVAEEVVRAVALLEASEIEPAAERTGANPAPQNILVMAGDLPYHVVVGWNNLAELGSEVRRRIPQARRAAIVAGDGDELVAAELAATVQQAGISVTTRVVSSAECRQPFALLPQLYAWLSAEQLGRDDLVLVAGSHDLAQIGGFVAATYQHGIALIRMPTTLAGMAGGMVGGMITLPHTDCAVGMLYHPRLVWADAAILTRTSRPEARAGWAHAIQYAMLEQALVPGETTTAPLFDTLEQQVEQLRRYEPEALLALIRRCAALKAHVAAADERERGAPGMLLQFGFAVGNAVHSVAPQLAQDEALAIGMAAETRLAVERNLAQPPVARRLEGLLARFGLPIAVPNGMAPALLEYLQADIAHDTARWVLPRSIGRAAVASGITVSDLRRALAAES
jgi:3-dehydroquinate synthetase/shikimate kinase